MTTIAEKSYHAYYSLCRVLERNDIDFRCNEKELRVTSFVAVGDIELKFIFSIDPCKMLVSLYAPVPLIVPPDNITDISLAICMINNSLSDGHFCIDTINRGVCFRMTSSFYNSRLNDSIYEYMLSAAADSIDEYYPKLKIIMYN